MASIFTKIINGEIPCYKIAEDDKYIAFLDINPIEKGHTLVVPKKEIDYIFDLDNETLSGILLFAKKIAKAIDKTMQCKRVAMAVLGLEVPHAHIHLIPMNDLNATNFTRPKLTLSKDEMENIANKIRSAIEN